MSEDEIAAIDAVRELNLIIHEQINMDDESQIPFLMHDTDGFSSVIKFMGLIIWGSEDDERREEDGIYEDMEIYLRRVIRDMLKSCNAINLDEVKEEDDKDSTE